MEDPRITESRRRIFAATLSEFARLGFDGVTIEGVAAEAGVGKSTIYRHWSGKFELIEAALGSLSSLELDHSDEADDRHVSDRVTDYLTALLHMLHRSVWSEVLPALVHAAERSESVAAMQRRFGERRRDVIVEILREGVVRGELADDLDLEMMAKALAAPILLDRLLQHRETRSSEIESLVRIVLRP